MSTTTNGLSAPHTEKGRLQRALLKRLRAHQREGTLPTSIRFLFYELVQDGIVPKQSPGKRGASQYTINAVTHLREVGEVPWDWIEDETRSLDEWQTAPTVAEYVADAVQDASIDRWGQPAPLVLCESRSLAGVLRGLAARYACPIAATNGQARGFLITKVAPTLQPRQRVLYLGDWDFSGHKIENNSRRVLEEHVGGRLPWERVALTRQQVQDFDLPVIQKLDKRSNQTHASVETEALGQVRIVAAVQARLDELMPEPLADVLAREHAQRAEVAEQLRGMNGGQR